MGLLFGTICCSCLVFLGHGPPCTGPPLPKTTCGTHRCVVWCGRCCCVALLCCVWWCVVVVWCVGAVCVQDFRRCVQDLCAPPPPPDPLSPTPFRRTAQNFALFFPLPPQFSLFLPLLWVVSWNFGGVMEGRDPQMCTFGVPSPENSTKPPPREEERMKKGKKRNFGPPHPSGPHPSGAPPFQPHFSRFGLCTLRASTLRGQ